MYTIQTDQRDSIVIDSTKFGKEQRILLENGVQTHAVRLRASAAVTVTTLGPGVQVNKGSLFAAFDTIKIVHGAELHVYNGAQLAYLTELASPSQRTCTRVPSAPGVATYNLVEEATIYFAHPYAVKARETALMEWNPSAKLELAVTANANPLNRVLLNATTASMGTITISVSEEFDRFESALPWFQTYAEQRSIDVAGTVNGTRFDLPIADDEWLRGILLQEWTDTTGEVSDILNSFRLRDSGVDLFGPTNFVSKDDYQRRLEQRFGGAVYDKPYTPIWFQYDARLSSLHKPRQLSLYYNAQASVAGTGTSHIIVTLIKCKRDLRKDPVTGRMLCDPRPLPFKA